MYDTCSSEVLPGQFPRGLLLYTTTKKYFYYIVVSLTSLMPSQKLPSITCDLESGGGKIGYRAGTDNDVAALSRAEEMSGSGPLNSLTFLSLSLGIL